MELNIEQKGLKSAARALLDKEFPKSVLRELVGSHGGYPAGLYAKMADLGWFALLVPEEYDGVGGSFVDMLVLLEEMGRACLPGPFIATAVLGAQTLVMSKNDFLKQQILPPLAGGRALVTFALTEQAANYEPGSIHIAVAENGDEFVLNGTKLFVPSAHVVDYLIVAAKTGNNPNPKDNVSLFLVDARASGLTTDQWETIGSDRQCKVVFDGVRMPRTHLLGERDRAWPIVERVLDYAAVALCARMVGGAQKALEISVDYANHREASGRPISGFQAIQFHCANLVSDVNASRYITYKAAWALDQRHPKSHELASAAKAWTSDAYVRIAQTAHCVHGAIGFSEEYDLQFYVREAAAAWPTFGGADAHREQVALGILANDQVL